MDSVPSLLTLISKDRPRARYIADSSIESACSAVKATAITAVIRNCCHLVSILYTRILYHLALENLAGVGQSKEPRHSLSPGPADAPQDKYHTLVLSHRDSWSN